jgi:cysteine-rich repeat protein
MKRFTSLLPAIFLFSCGAPPGDFPPFIRVEVVDPVGFIAPLGDTWEVTSSAVLNGNPISNTNEVLDPANPLPSDLTISFSEQVRGQNVTIFVEGFAGGVSVFSANGAATAGDDSISIVARFCGDNTIDDRSEACDDGASNSDSLPDACRTSCQLPVCGDGVVDSGEECDNGSSNSDTAPNACRTTCVLPTCGDGITDTNEACDDGNLTDADGCEANCALPSCNNGIFEPEDFQDPNDPNQGGHCFESESLTTVENVGLVTEVVSADMDEDGNQDLVVATDQCEVKIFYGNGDGTFDPNEFILSSPGCSEFIAVGDFLGSQDGRPDIAAGAAITSPTNFAIFKNLGGRNSFTTQTIPYPPGFQRIRDLVLTDFDRDGKLNLLVLDGGVASYQEAVTVFNPIIIASNAQGTTMDIGDIDEDLNPDILPMAPGANSIATFSFIANTIGFPVTIFSLNFKASAGKRNSMILIDANNDTHQDIVSFDSGTVKSVIFFGNGDGTFATSPEVVLGDQATGVQKADLNNDGLNDAIYFNNSVASNKSVTFFLSDEVPFLMRTVVIENTISVLASTISDFNNDGIQDIVAVRADASGTPGVFDNNVEMFLFKK